jgi:antitoxin ParD1/3/4
MNVKLAPQTEELVREKVASGRYGDENAVIHEAMLALEDQERLESLRAAIAIGDEEIERGEVVLYTPELFEEIKRNAEKKLQEGRMPDPDVCP